ncbi:MAG: NAD-dependent dihydroorotate dehydrogenase B electron transfer subunit [Candidatus Krumholzibacteriota bacterium]|nr:NAD-dependent dihydroorotate dehydrogenase B electron transfer subunit [Candidatus Krumholzibacteriota bacterium]
MTAPLTAVWREGRVVALARDGTLFWRLDVASASPAPPARPGQFYLVGPGRPADPPRDPPLLRPLSVLDETGGRPAFLFKVVGRGTAALADLAPGDPLRLLGPLGTAFAAGDGPAPILLGGGAGVPPLCFLSRILTEAGRGHRVLFGFGTAPELPRALLDGLAADVEICTLDGSAGFAGNPVGKLLAGGGRPPARLQACGPAAMLDAVRAAALPGDRVELSLEERMACGTGVCRGCVIPVADGKGGWRYAAVCREGPVFDAADLWTGPREDPAGLADGPAPGANGGAGPPEGGAGADGEGGRA